MVNEFLQESAHKTMIGRPTPDAAWGLLSQSLTGYDWHGGYYAAPRHAPAPASQGLRSWLRARRDARELAQLSIRERRDARLPEPARRPVSRDALWQRVASWAQARVPGDPCPEGGC